MIDALLGTPPDRRLLPGGRLAGPTPWLIAIMMFVMICVGAAGLALVQSARLVRAGATHRYSIQIADGTAQAPAAIAAAKRAPGVVAVTPVPESELRATLSRWLGPSANDPRLALPLPALIDVDLADGVDPATVGEAVRHAVPSAQWVAHSDRLKPMLGALSSLALAAGAIVALTVLATAAAVILAARSSFEAHRQTIDIMHGVGATDEQIARLFQRKLALDSLTGGIAGGLLAALVLGLVAWRGIAAAGAWSGARLLSNADLALLASLPFLGAILATIVARTTVLRAMRQAL